MPENSVILRNTGLNFYPGKPPDILVWAPFAKTLEIRIEGKKNHVLQMKKSGYWHTECPDAAPGDKYRLLMNNRHLYPDPASLSQPDGVHGASQAIDLNVIRDIVKSDWQGIPFKDLIIYELHVGTFTKEGTLEAMQGRLEYLKKLGVNAIEIMPVAAFPGTRNWGYDGVFLFAVQHSYGGPEQLALLVKACHEMGLAVILDVVYNHLGPEGNYLKYFGPYFSAKHKTPWGKAINFDGEGSEQARSFFIENALMWLRDFRIDGLRLDAVHAITDESPKHFLAELSEKVHKLNRLTGARHFLIGESDLNDAGFVNPPGKGGYGLDALWCDDFHHSIHPVLSGEKSGYCQDFGSLSQIAKAFSDAFVYDGIYSKYRRKVHGNSAKGQPAIKFVVYIQNHDQVGNRLKGDRLSQLLDFEALKLAAGAMLFSPYIPMLFMGEEYAEDSPFLFFTDHGDEKLAARVRQGRKCDFRDFMNDAEPPDPQAMQTFLQSKLEWDFEGKVHKEKLLAFYTECIRIRKENASLITKNRENLLVQNFNDEGVVVLKYIRPIKTPNSGGDINTPNQIMVIMNFSENLARLPIQELTTGNPALVLYSAHERWGGLVEDNSNFLESGSIVVEKRSVAVFNF